MDYDLIDIDQMEPSLVRRRLRRWSEPDEEAIRPLIISLQAKGVLSDVSIRSPRYETCVYPLYYHYAYTRQVPHREVYVRTVEAIASCMGRTAEADLIPHLERIADTEIDILIEDQEYFVFLEAKEVQEGKSAKFEKTGGVHQLVRQMLQGKLLERLISKKFVLATIGANGGNDIEILLNETESALLRVMGETSESLKCVDLVWP